VTKKYCCVTKRCSGIVEIDPAHVEQSGGGHWQFHCPLCDYWNLVSRDGAVQATSQKQFDLEFLPPSLRSSGPVKRSPPGGI
jgi:hypothetical protein